MEPKFKTGDTVILITGGPKMTIKQHILKRNLYQNHPRIRDEFEGEYECNWFEGDVLKSDYFHEDSLVSSTQ